MGVGRGNSLRVFRSVKRGTGFGGVPVYGEEVGSQATLMSLIC